MKILKAAVILSLSTSLTACGGGGGSSVPTQKIPTATEIDSMTSLYSSSILNHGNLLEFLLTSFPVFDSGFKLDSICPYGGTAVLDYQDNNDNLISAEDTYTITYNNCVGTNYTYKSGSIMASVSELSRTPLPDFNTGGGVFTSDWFMGETVGFNNLVVVDNMNSNSSTLYGTMDLSVGNDLTISRYHLQLLSSDFQSDSIVNGVASILDYVSSSFIFETNTTTNNFTLDHDFYATLTRDGISQKMNYMQSIAFSGVADYVGDTHSAPTAGSLIIEWFGYNPITLEAQSDGLNVAVQIVGEETPATLVPWSTLGFY